MTKRVRICRSHRLASNGKLDKRRRRAVHRGLIARIFYAVVGNLDRHSSCEERRITQRNHLIARFERHGKRVNLLLIGRKRNIEHIRGRLRIDINNQAVLIHPTRRIT